MTSDGRQICESCYPMIDPANDPKRACPVDGRVMDKELVCNSFFVDKCPACGGVWVDGADRERTRVLLTEAGPRYMEAVVLKMIIEDRVYSRP